jgi:hypothetical protein
MGLVDEKQQIHRENRLFLHPVCCDVSSPIFF